MSSPKQKPAAAILLTELAASIELRGKAIRSHGSLELSVEPDDSGERLNVDFSGTLRYSIRLSVWADGAFWVGVTKPASRRKGGWEHKSEISGWLKHLKPHDVVERFERTISSPTSVQEIWSISTP